MNIPGAVQSERAIIGTLFIRPEAWDDLAPMLSEEAFTSTLPRACYKYFQTQRTRGEWWTKVTALEYLKQKFPGKQMAGDLAELPYHYATIGFCLDVECKVVRDAWILRKLQAAGIEMSRYQLGADPLDVIIPSRDAIDKLEALIHTTTEVSVHDVLSQLIAQLKAGKRPKGISCGVAPLDRGVGGLYNGFLYVVGARPSTGKTAFVVTMAIAAARDGAAVRLITTETSKEIMTNKLSGHVAHFDAADMRDGLVEPAKLVEAARLMPDITIVDSDISTDEIRAGVKKWRAEHLGPAVVFLDYLELVQVRQKTASEEQRVATIIREMHRLTQKERVAMVVMSQLARESEKGGGEPKMRDLRYSGAIEAAADFIGLMWSSDHNDGRVKSGKMKVAKNKITGKEYVFDYVLHKGEARVTEVADDGLFEDGDRL